MSDYMLLEAIANQAATVLRLRDHFATTGDWQARSDYHASVKQLRYLLRRWQGKPEGEEE